MPGSLRDFLSLSSSRVSLELKVAAVLRIPQCPNSPLGFPVQPKAARAASWCGTVPLCLGLSHRGRGSTQVLRRPDGTNWAWTEALEPEGSWETESDISPHHRSLGTCTFGTTLPSLWSPDGLQMSIRENSGANTTYLCYMGTSSPTS